MSMAPIVLLFTVVVATPVVNANANFELKKCVDRLAVRVRHLGERFYDAHWRIYNKGLPTPREWAAAKTAIEAEHAPALDAFRKMPRSSAKFSAALDGVLIQGGRLYWASRAESIGQIEWMDVAKRRERLLAYCHYLERELVDERLNSWRGTVVLRLDDAEYDRAERLIADYCGLPQIDFWSKLRR